MLVSHGLLSLLTSFRLPDGLGDGLQWALFYLRNGCQPSFCFLSLGRSPTPWEVQALIIWTLDIGEDPYDPGYVTPYSWVCKDWCREIRKRIYRRCNLKRIETANWFLLSIYDSAVSFRGSPGMGSLITTVSFSFIPALNGMESFCHDYSDSFTQYDYDFDPCKTKEDNRSFWDRLKEAAKYMVSLETLYLCYGTNSLDVTIFALYSQCASAFPSSLKTLILRPQQVQWVRYPTPQLSCPTNLLTIVKPTAPRGVHTSKSKF